MTIKSALLLNERRLFGPTFIHTEAGILQRAPVEPRQNIQPGEEIKVNPIMAAQNNNNFNSNEKKLH